MYDVVFMVMQVVQSIKYLLDVSSDSTLVNETEFPVCCLQRMRHKFHEDRGFILFFVCIATVIADNVIMRELS